MATEKKTPGTRKARSRSNANQDGEQKQPPLDSSIVPDDLAGRDSTPIPATTWERDPFLNECKVTAEAVEGCGLSWEELSAIYEDHVARRESLEGTAAFIAQLLRRIPEVHSVRVRIKEPAHLIRKIIRKRGEAPERDIRFATYREHVTDLIGIRALHLYKEEWDAIHAFIQSEWDLVEQPTAYVREGDHQAWLDEYKARGCKVEGHPRKYRSVHYLLKSAPSKVPSVAEVQVRTIFEEGWSEIDHRINYPEAASHPSVGFFLGVLNRLAGSADEMGSFIHSLVADLNAQSTAVAQAQLERDEALQKVEEVLSKLEMSKAERTELQKEMSRLRASASTTLLRADTSASQMALSGVAKTTLIRGEVSSFPHLTLTNASSIGALSGTIEGTAFTYRPKSHCFRCSREFEQDSSSLSGSVSMYCDKCQPNAIPSSPWSIP
jgi:putative GTP pyrophosphokinase